MFATLPLSLSLIACTACGAVVGLIVGILPGVGPLTAFALLSAWIYALPVEQGFAVVMGIYFGAQYGGAIPAILLGIPGETSALPSCIAGRQLAAQGHAADALRIAAWSSLAGGVVSLMAITFLTAPLAKFALKLGPADVAGLFLFGLVVSGVMVTRPGVSGWLLLGMGWLLGSIGVDPETGIPRGTFGISELVDGIGVGLLGIGLFGFGSLPWIGHSAAAVEYLGSDSAEPGKGMQVAAVFRGSAVGTLMGLVPGGGAVLGATAAYFWEKRIQAKGLSNTRNLLASPEAANNAGAQSGMIPLLALGLPTNPALAIMASLLVAKGMMPGPGLMRDLPALLAALLSSILVGNVIMVLVMNANAGLWARLATLSTRTLQVIIGAAGLSGAYFSNGSWVDVGIALVMGAVGLVLHWRKVDPTPVFMGFILGPLFEEYALRAHQLHLDVQTVVWQPGMVLAIVFSVGILIVRCRVWNLSHPLRVFQ